MYCMTYSTRMFLRGLVTMYQEMITYQPIPCYQSMLPRSIFPLYTVHISGHCDRHLCADGPGHPAERVLGRAGGNCHPRQHQLPLRHPGGGQVYKQILYNSYIYEYKIMIEIKLKHFKEIKNIIFSTIIIIVSFIVQMCGDRRVGGCTQRTH